MGQRTATPDIFEIRRRRLAQLLRDRFHGIQTELANAINRQPDYISRLLSTGKARKNLGEKLAREIEFQLGLPPFWLDQEAFEGPLVAAQDADASNDWPFTFDRRRWERLTKAQRDRIEGVIEQMIEMIEADRDTRPRQRQ